MRKTWKKFANQTKDTARDDWKQKTRWMEDAETAEAPIIRRSSSLRLERFACAATNMHPTGTIDTRTTCSADASDYSYSETLSSTLRTIATNHCPNHVWTQLNPNSPLLEARTYDYPLYPKYDPSALADLTSQGGTVGTFFSGAMLFSGYGGPMSPAARRCEP